MAWVEFEAGKGVAGRPFVGTEPDSRAERERERVTFERVSETNRKSKTGLDHFQGLHILV